MTQRRRAVSMIETIVAVAMSGVVLVTGVGMIHMVMGIQRTTRQSAGLSIASARLSNVFRQDVHRATHFEVAAEDETDVGRLALRLPGARSVVYQADANRLGRVESVGGQPHHQDEFVFPVDCQATMQVSRDPDRVAISVRQPISNVPRDKRSTGSGRGAPGGLVVRIEATIARDHRYDPDAADREPSS